MDIAIRKCGIRITSCYSSKQKRRSRILEILLPNCIECLAFVDYYFLACKEEAEKDFKEIEEDKIKEPKVLAEIDKLVNFIRNQEKIDKAMSIIDFLKDPKKLS